jgi:nicotinate-nucleotide adenylyltransferase
MIGIFGGTFDPPHLGHIRLAEQAIELLALDEVQFLPCANPVHRSQPMVIASDRLQMLELAVANRSGLSINTLELDRGGPSYMVDSLRQIRDQYEDASLCLLLGADAFNAIQSWKSPDEILKLANLVVCRRPGLSLDKSVFVDHQIDSALDLRSKVSGCILALDIEENPCSSTEVREWLTGQGSVENCLPQSIIDYINQHHLYET